MLKRINISLTQPKLIGQFLNDKKRAIIGYLLLLLVIVTLPTLIKSVVSEKMDQEFKSNFESEMIRLDLDYQITNYQLSNLGTTGIIAVDSLNGVAFNEVINLNTISNIEIINAKAYIFNFTEKEIEFYFGFSLVNKFTYEELALNDVEFTNKSDISTILTALDQVYLKNKSKYESIKVISFYIAELITVLFFIILSVLIYGLQRPKLKAKYRFVLTTYSFTIFLLGSLLAQLFDFSPLKLIALVWALINLANSYKHLMLLSKIAFKENDSE